METVRPPRAEHGDIQSNKETTTPKESSTVFGVASKRKSQSPVLETSVAILDASEVCEQVAFVFAPHRVSVFAIYRGYGVEGEAACQKLASQLHVSVLNKLCSVTHVDNALDIQHAITEAFVEADRLLVRVSQVSAAVCAVLCIVIGSNLYVANVGDSRAVYCEMYRNGAFGMQLTADDSTAAAEERQRIYEGGGAISAQGLVEGEAVTRSLGRAGARLATHDLVVSQPHVHCVRLETPSFLVLASASFWRTCSVEEVCRKVQAQLQDKTEPHDVVTRLVSDAAADDMTVLLVHFRRQSSQPMPSSTVTGQVHHA
eukprot:GILK01004313.1.p1 GENE.GILK01004313.1~~GILK01004313.1.p1  ORF type:complete len:335 (-),score=20.88 GILK01004313.1:367-1311(-)